MRFKRKKHCKMRGSRTYGFGSHKKHRGAGHRGGRGNAGSGKRADAKKPSIWSERHIGKYGFISKKRKEYKSINLRDIQERLPQYVASKLASEKNGVFALDLGKLGYTKLLGSGQVDKKMDITVELSTKRAIDKVTAVGGKVNLP